MTFNEALVNRDKTGKFDQKVGTPSTVTLPSPPAQVGDLIEYQVRGFTSKGIDNGDGTASHFTTEGGRRAVRIAPIPEGAVVRAPAGSPEASGLASDLVGAPGSQNVGAALRTAIDGRPDKDEMVDSRDDREEGLGDAA